MGGKRKKLGDVCKTGSVAQHPCNQRVITLGGTVPWLLSGEVSQGDVTEKQNFITQKGRKIPLRECSQRQLILVAMMGYLVVGILRYESRRQSGGLRESYRTNYRSRVPVLLLPVDRRMNW